MTRTSVLDNDDFLPTRADSIAQRINSLWDQMQQRCEPGYGIELHVCGHFGCFLVRELFADDANTFTIIVEAGDEFPNGIIAVTDNAAAQGFGNRLSQFFPNMPRP